ncbi:MAG TPA: PBSX family phage terminase large subunit [Lachnoclostridium sp.]|nr:PBSX family phage terminase large subunit [Lachnoclostridium sp.]
MRTRKKRPIFKFQPFSRKQRMVLNWWTKDSPVKDMDGIIADGAIRSGKTVSMSLSYVMWAMSSFNGQDFIMAGKTISSFQRNVLTTLRSMLSSRGYKHVYHISGETPNMLEVTRGNVTNYFHIFGGKDEGSQELVQGLTAAGVFLDEVALMPESFVNQATGRCSVKGSKFWFNCNPSGPMHWFKIGWINKSIGYLGRKKAEELIAADKEVKNILYLHFTMDDNLSLDEEIKKRYRSMYAGVFFLRYIKGLWAVAEGLIYTMFTKSANIYNDETRPKGLEYLSTRTIALDYGTTNPCVFLDIYDDGDTIWVDREYRWDSRVEKEGQKTDSQYGDDMVIFMGDNPDLQCDIVADPSAASFIVELKGRGYIVKPGDNEVEDGIRVVAALFQSGKIKVHERCTGLITELRSYVWDDKAAQHGDEKPVKQLDHGPDALRYFCMTKLPKWRRNVQ